jgi:2-polyprenyl-6-methoxyphenol hydroxylase-like FAD-dependent oxidoreductase
VLGEMANSLPGDVAQGVIRPVFHNFLAETLGSENVRLGKKLTRFEQDASTVTAHFEDGDTARGEVLVGADGFRSIVRRQLLGDSEPRYAGYRTRRGVVETDLAKDGLFEIFLGTGMRFLYYPVGRWWMYWTAATNESPGAREQPEEIRSKVLERFGGWPEPARTLVEATEGARMFVAETYDRKPVRRWGEGRVTLLGDAAHPMTWDRGQGAAQAIEGAVLLAKGLAQGGEQAAALRAWEAQRIRRTSKMVRFSRQIGKIQQSESGAVRLYREKLMLPLMTKRAAKTGPKDLMVDY